MSEPAALLATALRRGEPVVVLLGANPGNLADLLDQVESTLTGMPTRVIRIRGLEGQSLTLPRIAEELGAGAAEGASEDDDELIVRVLTKGRRGQGTILMIEHADALPTRTLTFLQVVSTLFGSRTPGLQLVLAGRTRLLGLIGSDDLIGLRDRIETVVEAPGAGTPLESVKAGAEYRQPAATLSKASGFPYKVAFCLIVVAVAGVAAGPLGVYSQLRGTDWARLFATSPPPADEPAAAPLPAEIASTPRVIPVRPVNPAPVTATPAPRPFDDRVSRPTGSPSTAPQALSPPPRFLPSPPSTTSRQALAPPAFSPPPSLLPSPPQEPRPGSAVPTDEELAHLRVEFQHFLDKNRSNRTLNDSARAELFADFLKWRYGHPGATRPDR